MIKDDFSLTTRQLRTKHRHRTRRKRCLGLNFVKFLTFVFIGALLALLLKNFFQNKGLKFKKNIFNFSFIVDVDCDIENSKKDNDGGRKPRSGNLT